MQGFGFFQEFMDTVYGREDALLGGMTPEAYGRFVTLERQVRAAVEVGYRERLVWEAQRREAERAEQARQEHEHAARTAHLLGCWPGLTTTRDVPQCAGVYVIRHVASGREYVGQSRCIRARWSGHLAELRSPYSAHPLVDDWNADGPAAFAWEIVQVVGEPEPPERLSPDALRGALLIAEHRWIAERQPAYNRGG